MSQFYVGVTTGSLPPSVATLYEGNTGAGAVPVANVLNVVGVGNISVDATGNNLTITQAGAGLTWNDRNASFAVSSNNGYFVSATSTATLPAAPAQGDVVEFAITSAGVTLTIQANAGQFIRIGTDISLVVGSTVGTTVGDSISFTYQAASSTWFAITAPQGTWTT